MGCYLELEIVDIEENGNECDGCDKRYKVGDKKITGIESCCGGGCKRNLCEDCVKIAIKLILKPQETTRGDRARILHKFMLGDFFSEVCEAQGPVHRQVESTKTESKQSCKLPETSWRSLI